MVTTKNLLIIFAVLLLLLTLLSAFGGSIHPVENFDYSRNPVTGGKSSEYFTHQEGPMGPMQGPMGPMQGPMGPMQGPMTSMEHMNYPSKPMSLPSSMTAPSASDDLYESPVNYGIVENFANSVYVPNTRTLTAGLANAASSIQGIEDINNRKPEKQKINSQRIDSIQDDIINATQKISEIQKPNFQGKPEKFTQYPTATIEHFVEPFENDNGLKALYATV